MFILINLIKGILVITEVKTNNNNTPKEKKNTKSYDILYIYPIIVNLYID